jgi:flagellar basal-body rod protein FlgC
MTAINNAISGLRVEQTRLNVSASNTANQLSTYGEEVQADGSRTPINAPYEAREVQATSQQTGGAEALVRLSQPATVPVFDPSSSVADEDGVVQAPNVQQEDEIINRLLATQAYKANLSVIETEQETSRSLLDV